MDNDIYIAVDMKSFYASCEAVAMGLDPLKVKLLVADPSRSDQTICLAVSPSLKAIGVPGRPRLFEAKRAIRDYEKRTRKKVPRSWKETNRLGGIARACECFWQHSRPFLHQERR